MRCGNGIAHASRACRRQDWQVQCHRGTQLRISFGPSREEHVPTVQELQRMGVLHVRASSGAVCRIVRGIARDRMRGCHLANVAKTDMTYVQFYPLLRDKSALSVTSAR
jgi:hypothetical protein